MLQLLSLCLCLACVDGFTFGLPRAPPAAARGLSMSSKEIQVAVLGASGYTGAELLRILSVHPSMKIRALTADRSAGEAFRSSFPQYSHMKDLPILTKISDSTKEISECDIVFCCLPHATTQEIISGLPPHLKVVDLSADFRLKDVKVYEKWYGNVHAAPELQKEAVYGLTEINREQIRTARLVANPGCYPTAAQLPLVPLLRNGAILTEDIIIDAKSGTSGAGRSPKQGILYCEVTEGIHAYGIASHRHAPEIEQGLSEASGQDVIVNFTPHLMPMSRGILETIYVKCANGHDASSIKKILSAAYVDEQFVHIMEGTEVPQTRHVRGSNYCYINVFDDRVQGRVVIVSAIDNLVKGAAGQAVQNANLMLGIEESTALTQPAMFP